MYRSTALLLQLLSVIGVNAECYTGHGQGDGWEGQQNHAKWHAWRACHGYEENGRHIQGAFE